MLLVDVHELEVVLANTIVAGALEHEVEGVGRILGLQRQDIVVLCRPQDLGQGDEVDAEGDVSVASVRGEAFRLEHHRHEGHMRVVHGLQGDARVVAIKVAVLDKILDGIHHLFTVSPGMDTS